jgi:hypothetical protein
MEILGTFGNFREILGNFGKFWEILGNFGKFWEILGNGAYFLSTFHASRALDVRTAVQFFLSSLVEKKRFAV